MPPHEQWHPKKRRNCPTAEDGDGTSGSAAISPGFAQTLNKKNA
jgi:hypothetical protein